MKNFGHFISKYGQIPITLSKNIFIFYALRNETPKFYDVQNYLPLALKQVENDTSTGLNQNKAQII